MAGLIICIIAVVPLMAVVVSIRRVKKRDGISSAGNRKKWNS